VLVDADLDSSLRRNDTVGLKKIAPCPWQEDKKKRAGFPALLQKLVSEA
jgi:hypothetical protein